MQIGSKPITDEQVAALADAMCSVLNEVSEGNTVCDYVKAKARVAFEPFMLDDNGDLPDIEQSHAIINLSSANYE